MENKMVMPALLGMFAFGFAIGFIIGRARLDEVKRNQYQQGRTDEYQLLEDVLKREQQIKDQHTLHELERKVAKLEAQHQKEAP
jgi:hypothetical protein